MEASQHNGSERNGEGDQVHLLVNYPAKRAISTLVNHLKGVSCRSLGIEVLTSNASIGKTFSGCLRILLLAAVVRQTAFSRNTWSSRKPSSLK